MQVFSSMYAKKNFGLVIELAVLLMSGLEDRVVDMVFSKNLSFFQVENPP